MKVFIGYLCTKCHFPFDTDSRNLNNSDPKCPKCGHTDTVNRVFVEINLAEVEETL